MTAQLTVSSMRAPEQLTTASSIQAPGPGTWELDVTHFARPVSPIAGQNMVRQFPAGMAEASARYGVPLERLAYAQVDGWMYDQPQPIGAPPGARTPPRLIFWLISRLHPEFRRRAHAARRSFMDRLWRADVERWQREIKPAQVRKHMRLASESVVDFSDAQLFDHLERCIQTHADSVRLHGYLSIPAILPIADFIAHVRDWTGIAPHDLLPALATFSPISAGHEPSREALIALLRSDARASGVLQSAEEPGHVVDALRRLPGEGGAVARAYLDSAGFRIVNSYDVLDQYALEAPFLIIEGLRVLVERGAPDVRSRAEACRTEIRDAVSSQHRSEFDALFEEACFVAPLRDERVLFNDPWSAGLTRRALLELGRRLVQLRLMDKAEHATCCGADELRSMLLERKPPGFSPGERWLRYRTATCASAPAFLGPPAAPPPPAEWFPEPLARWHRATLTALAAIFGEPEHHPSATLVQGFGVSPGTYQGVARVVIGPDDFHRIRPGDVLVSPTTSPTYNILLPLLGAVVTDRGGALSHAAIVSREYGIPGIVGCRNATTVIPDGKPVLVDGSAGECRVVA